MFSMGIFPLLSKDGCSTRNNSTNSLIKIKHPRLSRRKPIYVIFVLLIEVELPRVKSRIDVVKLINLYLGLRRKKECK